jgi:Holliday junction resolvasome RuvABC endonuclease subunit
MIITVSSFDPSLRNFGMAKLTLDLDTLAITIADLKLIKTEKQASKQVRQNSDDLRRAKELVREFQSFAGGTRIGFAEIPSGAQSARAAYSFGVSVGILAASPVPLIQVQPFETKLASVGTKTASKEEVIEWAVEAYPDAPWLKRKNKGNDVLLNDNEHLADAVAIAHAGIKTDQFRQIRALWLGKDGMAAKKSPLLV